MSNDLPFDIIRSEHVAEGEAFVLGDWLERDEYGEPTGRINAAAVVRVTGLGAAAGTGSNDGN